MNQISISVAILETLCVLAGALLWDRLFGEPPSVMHPVVWMGRVISWCEKHAPRRAPPLTQLAVGVAIAVGVPGLFALGVSLLMGALSGMPWLRLLVSIWLLKSTFAVSALGAAATEVRRALALGDLAAARTALGSLCSRDPSELDAAGVAAGAVESVAENTSDSVVAPLLFYVLFGLPGAMFYRAVNTLDARIGYHGRYEFLGKASARLDDLLNWVPARLAAGLLLVVGAWQKLDARRGWQVMVRDGGRTESPNAGRPMAAMAGLLGVRLEKPGHYALGDDVSPVGPQTIAAAWRVARAASLLAFVVAALALRAGS
jgi:adenosylcobinamide-phosphate synthase